MAKRQHSIVDRLAASVPTSGVGKALVGGAVALAAAGLWNTVQARRAERRHPPSGRFVTVDGTRIHYLERGSGPPVVLLHGNVVCAEDFVSSGIFDGLAEGYRVIAFDRPGFGYSERPHGTLWTASAQAQLLRRACAQLGLDRPVVVGHSWGTLVALELALEHPDAVGGLVLLSGYYQPTARLDVPMAALAAVPVLGDLLRYTISPLFGAALLPLNIKTMFSPRPVPESFHRDFAYGFPVRPWQIRAESQDAATMVPAAAALRPRYGELKLPMTIVAGTEDKVVDPDKQAVWFGNEIHGSELKLVPGAGHMVHYAVPKLVVDAVAAMTRREVAVTARLRRPMEPDRIARPAA